MSVLPRIEREVYEGFVRLGFKEKDMELLDIARKIETLNSRLKSLEEALRTCKPREIVYYYGRVMGDIEKLKDVIMKRGLALKPMPEEAVAIIDKLEDMEKEIMERATEGIKTCSIRGLIE